MRQRDYAQVEARLAAAMQPPLRRRCFGQQAGRYNLWEVRVPATAPAGRWRPQRRVLLSGGMHGDEPAGMEAVLQFLETRRYAAWPTIAFTVLPCLNPWGYVHDTREGPAGIDLNRSFRRAPQRAPEVSAIKRAIERRRFAAAMDCHEDCDAAGFYVFEVPAVTGLGKALVRAVAAVGPISPDGIVEDDVPVRGGIARPDEIRPEAASALAPEIALDGPLDFPTFVQAWPTWPFPIYLWRYHAAQAFTFETPTKLPLAQRVAMQLAAIEAVLDTLTATS